jgi:hypothetical protein
LTNECKSQVCNGIVTPVFFYNIPPDRILTKVNACHEKNISLTILPSKKWIPSEFIRRWNLSYFKPFAPTRHGPAAQAFYTEPGSTITIDYDFVPYIHFEGWPKYSSEWIIRWRPNNWPPKELILEVVQCGFGVTPVGYDYNMNMTDYEWRMSFSKAENMLFRSIELEKLVFFAEMKTVIKSSDVNREILSSYYL